jgi:aryl-alcohol dehydrogenase-like predicted oxidoreductase
MQITRIGFGTWAIGGGGWAGGWGTQRDEDSNAAIRHAIDCGINWIDTAPIYGLGRSEEIVRLALRSIPAERRPYVFTKCGLIRVSGDRRAPPARIGTPQSIRRELEGSLRRLGVERIDLYQMHFPPMDGTPLEEYWQALLDLKRDGKIRAVGLSNHNAAQLEAAERCGHVDVLQPRFSAIDRDAASSLFPSCEANGTGIIVYSPMQSGLLTGSFTAARVAGLPDDDWRSKNAEFAGRKLERNLALVDALRPVALRLGVTVSAVAVAWTLAWPGVTGAIVGGRQASQLEDWIAAATLELSVADLRQIADAIRATQAGRGPLLPPTVE